MRFFNYETKDKQLNLYPLVCWHRGAEQSDDKFINTMIERIKDDPHARWVYMGDGGECTTRISKGDIWKQNLNPGDQIKDLIRLLKPIKNKGLFFINGNHGHRIYKEVGLEFDEMAALGLGLPYLGVDALWRLKVNRSVYSVYTHHGKDSGVSLSSKVNAAKAAESIVNADAIMTAHSHIGMELPPRYMAELNPNVLGAVTRGEDANPIQYQTTHEYVCGCAYDSRTGYAAQKLYPPILPSHLKIEFSGKINNGTPVKTQSCTIYRPDA